MPVSARECILCAQPQEVSYSTAHRLQTFMCGLTAGCAVAHRASRTPSTPTFGDQASVSEQRTNCAHPCLLQLQAVPPHVVQVAPPPLQPLEVELQELSSASEAQLARGSDKEGAAPKVREVGEQKEEF